MLLLWLCTRGLKGFSKPDIIVIIRRRARASFRKSYFSYTYNVYYTAQHGVRVARAKKINLNSHHDILRNTNLIFNVFDYIVLVTDYYIIIRFIMRRVLF